MGSFRDLSGQKFGKLTPIKRVYPEDKKNGTWWLCVCDCGNTIIVSSGGLTGGDNRTCKNCPPEKQYPKRLKNIFRYMKKRCYNKRSTGYHNYGGRGIKICDEWLNNPKLFYEWAENHGYRDDLSIDRINNDGDYTPDNCRWVGKKEQDRNKRTNHYLTYKGDTKCMIAWAEELDISYKKLCEKVRQGLTLEQIINDLR